MAATWIAKGGRGGEWSHPAAVSCASRVAGPRVPV